MQRTSTLPVYRAPSASTNAAYTQQVPSELVGLVTGLAESIAVENAGPSLGTFRIQCDDLRRLRQLLHDDDAHGVYKNGFRRLGGFALILDVLASLKDFYGTAKLSRDERTESFDVMKTSLDVLSEAMKRNPVNRRLYSTRIRDGGWQSLQKVLMETGISKNAEGELDFEALEMLFGTLLAFGTSEDSFKGLFRGLQKLCERTALETQSTDSNPPTILQLVSSAEQVVDEHILTKVSGKELFANPEIVPIIFGFWKLLLESCETNHGTIPLLLAIPMVVAKLQTSSERNELALHSSGLLRPLLEIYAAPLISVRTTFQVLLRGIIERLLDYGINDMNDAYFLFNNASTSEKIADLALHAMKASKHPPTIQFDLSMHGYSAIELEAIGRQFPPSSTNGYTVMAWARFDHLDKGSHTTIFGAADKSNTCFLLLFVEKDDHQLVLQTSVKDAVKASIRFRSVSFQEGRWYHIAVVHRRSRKLTPSKASLFINGTFVETIKCQYPANPPTRNTSAESFASMTGSTQSFMPVHAFLGTPADIALRKGRDQTLSKWSMASFHLFQDAINDDLIQVYEALGPRYVGNFQDSLGSFQTYRASAEVHLKNEQLHPVSPDKSDLMAALRQHAGQLVHESKLAICFSPTAVLYNEDRNHINETKLIKNLSKDASTSLSRTLHSNGRSVIINAAVPAISDAVTSKHGLGILHGEPVVSVPQALDDACWRLGGSAPVVLKLLDLARTKDEVIRAVQIAFASIENNWRNSEAIERQNAYGVLAGLMREKLGFGSIFGESAYASHRPPPIPVDLKQREELALELLRMTLAFVGYSETKPENALIINSLAYRYLLVDFDTWRRSPIATQKVYYSQFVHYAAKGKHHKFNAKRLIRMRIVKRLIDALKGESFSADVFPDFLDAFNAVFRCSISADTLRSLSMFITFAFQETRAFPMVRRLTSRNGDRNTSPGPSGRERSHSRPSPFNPPISPSSEVSRFEMAVQMLELYADIICEPGREEIVNRFATTVTSKWLLFLMAERDSRIIVLSTKILVRVLVVLGPSYVKSFDDRSGGFSLFKQRLKSWWSVPALWISLLALLFGVDVGTLDYVDDFNQFTLSDMFAKTGGRVVYPEALPIMAAMLESGLRAVVSEGHKAASGDDMKGEALVHGRVRGSSLNVDAVRGHTTFEVTNNAEVLSSVIRFLADLQLKSPSFRDFAATSSFVQEVLFVLYPVVVTSDSVSAETELNSRSALTFEGHDVVIKPPAVDENHRPRIVRSTTTSSSVATKGSSKSARATFRRPSSFILITGEHDNIPKPTKLNSVMSPHLSSGPIALRIGSNIVQTMLGVVVSVFLDQVLHRKDFQGLGLFLKVPPGFQEHQVYFESYVLSHAMSELSNTLRMQEQLLKEPRVITNVGRYVKYMAEAIFEGWFLDGAGQLLDFIGQTLEFLRRPDIAALKNVRLCSVATQNMGKVFLRIALLRLSEMEDETELEQKSTVVFLERLSYWQTVILTSDDDEHSYLRLLYFLLYHRIVSKSTSVRTAAIDFWRMLLVQKFDEAAYVFQHSSPASRHYLASGFLKLAELDNEAFIVWVDVHREELDAFFVGCFTRHWEEFVAEENRNTEHSAQSRISKRRERLKSWHEDAVNADNYWRKHESATTHWRNNVYASERLKHQRSVQDQQDNLSFTAATLDKFDRMLKGACALYEHDPEFKWRLDESEGLNRMRLRLIPDRNSSENDYQPKRKTSEHSKQLTPIRSRSLVKEATSNASGTPVVQEPGSVMPGRQRADSRASSHAGNEDEYEIIEDPRTDEGGEFEDKNRKVMRTLERGDQVRQVYNVSRIDGLEALEGLLIVGQNFLYLIDHYFQRADGEVVGVWQAPVEERDPYLRLISGRETRVGRPKIAPGEVTKRHWRWSDVMLVSKRRFLLRDVALEVFFTDGRSYLLTAISAELRNNLHTSLVARSPLLNNPAASLHPEDQWRIESLRNMEDVPQSFGSKFASVFNSAASNPATRKWMRGEISNFAYLMQVNTMAGRTFNDLTQYPVFPWVLSDYSSPELDLTDPHVFRDLTKPMGCQSPSREADFRERFSSVGEMTGEPGYHYGTHYSSAMTVAQYLIRLQPFVKSYLLLQGGSFDHADRLFYSIEKAWLSASKENMSDVRELTPEFFYLPEFLKNLNGYNFGATQGTGLKVGDVVLPAWAKGDPHIFIQKHREALESPYVSAHLHKWIDLVFGFKQQGEAAIESTNVFHYLSYHGAKDLDAITDPTERLASIGIIHNFGQTPRQIFTKHHPSRDDGAHHKSPDLNNILSQLTRSHAPLHEMRETISSLTWVAKHEKVIPQGPFSLLVPPAFDVIMRWGFADGSVRFLSADGKRALGLYENFHIGPPSAAVFVDGKTLITAGSDSVITIWNISLMTAPSSVVVGGVGAPKVTAVDVNQRDSLFGHRFPITLLVASKSLSTLLSADTSGRTLLWDLNRNEFVRELHPASPAPHLPAHEIRAARISAATGDIALASHRSLTLYSLNGNLLLSRDVCDAADTSDSLTSIAWYEGLRGEWVQRILLFTGHKNGMVRAWHKTLNKEGRWTLELVRRLPLPGLQRAGTVVGKQGHTPPEMVRGAVGVSAILPMSGGVWVGDEGGRMVSFVC
ncbi:beige/BEACH domain-containing protein [Microthyrium microscopicum]|uniref:Beige protein homolog 1 n=1 Tax=Microthyrium microscopicum TaxID=703497 RepID=A0A6A6ULA6_9PEZI|nr:beige/BEACH domain-containing protein [Microthyrium microscopicum]